MVMLKSKSPEECGQLYKIVKDIVRYGELKISLIYCLFVNV